MVRLEDDPELRALYHRALREEPGLSKRRKRTVSFASLQHARADVFLDDQLHARTAPTTGPRRTSSLQPPVYTSRGELPVVRTAVSSSPAGCAPDEWMTVQRHLAAQATQPADEDAALEDVTLDDGAAGSAVAALVALLPMHEQAGVLYT